MARFARVLVPGFPYHVTHRGNRGDDVFFSDDDRRTYLAWLRQYAAEFALEIWAYCLMSNHVHLLAVPRHPDSLAMAVGRTHMRYARRVNREHGWSGHLWANRFHSTPLDGAHLWMAAKYIETNPVRAGVVRRAEQYAWSSARAHAGVGVRRARGAAADPLLSPRRPFPDPDRVGNWSAWLAAGPQDEVVRAIRVNTSTGRPCGSARFVARLERRLGRTLAPQKRGPKPKGPGIK